MQEIDMSERAITARLKLVSELYRLGLSLQTAKIQVQADSQEDSGKDVEQPATEEKGGAE